MYISNIKKVQMKCTMFITYLYMHTLYSGKYDMKHTEAL